MAAYGAAISLKNTIHSILQSSRLSLVPPSPQILQPAYEAMVRLQKVLLKLDETSCSKIRTKVNALDERIKEAVWEFEDLLESLFAHQILQQQESSSREHLSFSVDLQSLQQSVDCCVERVTVMEAEYDIELANMPEEKGETISSRIDFSRINSEMVGSSDVFERVRDHLLAEEKWKSVEDINWGSFISMARLEMNGIDFGGNTFGLSDGFEEVRRFLFQVAIKNADYIEPLYNRLGFAGVDNMVGFSDQFKMVRDYFAENKRNWILVTGTAGVGKTTLAKKVFDDPSILRHFELRAWVKVGRKCESSETLRCILAQVDPNACHQMLAQEDDADYRKLVGLLEERLKDKKCIIVLDDVWEWDTRLMDYLPRENVRILLTSRQRIKQSPVQEVPILNEEQCKKLLGEKIFGEQGFPPDLEELGKKIADKCEGLPLMIVKVAELLSKANKSIAEELSKANKSTREELDKSIQEYWTVVAKKQHNSVFVDAYNQISEVLYPSYEYLPQYLKMFFLYLGACPPYIGIMIGEFMPNIIAEGFLESSREHTLEEYTLNYLQMLAHKYHLIRYTLRQSYCFFMNFSCLLSCWQHVCQREASKIKFLHILQSCDDVVKDQRRLCAHCNTLFAFKQVYDSIKSDCASTARSLICYGPYHQYPVPIHAMDFKLLRVLEAISIRFYHFPLEILKLVCLKYLSLTCNKELPYSISNLLNLQSLLIAQHMNIKKHGALSYMPEEVWGMQELQHLEVRGRDLPTPNFDATLDKLYSLRGVSAKSCTKEILKRIPNLSELEIVMELKPCYDDDDNNPLSGLDYISEELQNLKRLMYYVLNPEMKCECMVPLSMFSTNLTSLGLSGLGCPWKHMNDIGSLLPNLKELWLKHYAFRGIEWDIESGCFLKLKTLVIEDTDLVRWRAQHASLLRLDLLSMRHCYKLQQLDWKRAPPMLKVPTIELIECNLLAVASAKQLPESLFRLHFSSSF